MSASSTPKAYGGSQGKFSYMRTNLQINADFEDIQHNPPIAVHSSEASSQTFKSSESAVKGAVSPLKAIQSSAKQSSAKKDIRGLQVTSRGPKASTSSSEY